MTMRFGIVCVGLFLALPASAQDSNFQDALLDKFVGNWVLEGMIAGDEVTHDIVAGWVLDHQYLSFHEVARETTEAGIPVYEATVFIGWDEQSDRYVCMWLDSTGGGGLASGVFGYAEPSTDNIAFVFGTGNETIHTTFAYDRQTDSWAWAIDNVKDGQHNPFARVSLTRR